jgi:hypothetical protein
MDTTMDTKILNSRCICKGGLPWKNDIILMLDPCEHLIHSTCFIYFLKKNKSGLICPFCNSKVIDFFTKEDIKTKKISRQQYFDILSMSNYDKGTYFLSSFMENFVHLTSLLGYVSVAPLITNIDRIKFCESFFSLVNAKIIVNGLEKIKDKYKVFISKHICYLDVFVIHYILKCAFVASAAVRSSLLGSQLLALLPSLIIERGASNNSVEKIRDYVLKNGSICIFPEGMLVHPRCITRFRTGAFAVSVPIYAIVIRYDPMTCDGNLGNYIMKMTSQLCTNVYIDILGPYLPPFSPQDIENIRKDMANMGGMHLSRASNRDVVDE